MYPQAPLIERQGEVNAWDNEDFRRAVKAANKTQIIMAGITTDVCTTFLALSLREAGYSVWANAEASGTTTALVRDISNDRMSQAGVHIVSLFSIACDLMRDWRSTPGAAQMIPWLDKYFPVWGQQGQTCPTLHAACSCSGTLCPVWALRVMTPNARTRDFELPRRACEGCQGYMATFPIFCPRSSEDGVMAGCEELLRMRV